MVQEYGIDTICITEKLKPRSAIKGTLRGVRGGVKSPYSIAVSAPSCGATLSGVTLEHGESGELGEELVR